MVIIVLPTTATSTSSFDIGTRRVVVRHIDHGAVERILQRVIVEDIMLLSRMRIPSGRVRHYGRVPFRSRRPGGGVFIVST
jgi:hypothetical protein